MDFFPHSGTTDISLAATSVKSRKNLWITQISSFTSLLLVIIIIIRGEYVSDLCFPLRNLHVSCFLHEIFDFVFLPINTTILQVTHSTKKTMSTMSSIDWFLSYYDYVSRREQSPHWKESAELEISSPSSGRNTKRMLKRSSSYSLNSS